MRPDVMAGALVSLAAAVVALAVGIANPFAHDTWLVAYLVLVGFLAQLLLGLGQAALLSASGHAPPPRRVRLAQTLLWNIGVVAVPLGVLAQTRLCVVVGSLSLITALVALAETARPGLAGALGQRSRLGCGYLGLLGAMVASTLIGTALAWDIPWT